MQQSSFSGFPTVHSSFQRHRYNIDFPRFALNLTLTKTNPPPAWASLPTPPMSGSPQADPSQDPSQLAGQRRKRSDTPPETTATPVSTAPSFVEQIGYQHGDRPPGQRHIHPHTMQVATPTISYLPPLGYGIAPVTQYTPPDISLSQSQISPRSTRKTKAHVASACINCKKKHLRCDSSRPCRRCVQGGKEDTCKDVEHKKRGRPPLKPEDPSSEGRSRQHGPSSSGSFSEPTGLSTIDTRGYGQSMYPPILPSSAQRPYGYGHRRSPSRHSVYGTMQTPYAAPSVAQTSFHATASGFTYGQRPSSMSAIPPHYAMPPARTQEDLLPRQQSMYPGNYSYPVDPPELPTSSRSMYSNPIFPRESTQVTRTIENTSDAYERSGLQLPPIRPAITGSRSDTSVVQQRQQQQQQQQQQSTALVPLPSQRQSHSEERRDRDPKRPKMDIQGILGPKQD